VAALLALVLGAGLLLIVAGVSGVRTKFANHEIDSISGAPRQTLSVVVGVILMILAIVLGIRYLVGPNPSASQPTSGPPSRQPSTGGAPISIGSNPIDPLNCFGSPRDVTLDPASGPAGTWTRVRSKGYLAGEKVRVNTWAGSTWEATADSSGAISVRARIPPFPPGFPVNSVTVSVRGTKSGCEGDAVFAVG